MKAIAPTTSEGRPVIFAQDQPEYEPLPARLCADGRVMTEWQLSEDERALIARGENVRLTLLTFGAPLQPILIHVTTPEGG